MRGRSWRMLLVGWVAVCGSAAGAQADTAGWITQDWPVRRVFEAKPKPSGQPGGEVVAASFYSGGLVKPGGADIRVAVKGTQLIPHRVLQVGPGDFVRVAFEAPAAETRFFIYYGNPKADPPKPWEPSRGVLLEERTWPGGPFDNFKQVQDGWAKAKPLGADFVSHVSLGFNPLADSSTHAVSHYVGWFVPQKAGPYEVATTSGDGSWLLIDGKEVASWPGRHGVDGHAHHVGKVDLDVRVHRLDYWHVKADAQMMVVAAWRPAGTGNFEAIPANLFLPVTEAAPVEMDLRAEPLVADFFPVRAGETWWPDQYAMKIEFKNYSKGASLQTGGRYDWDFGDGQKGTGSGASHVYLAAGDYVVTMKVSRGAQASTFRTTVRVERDWWRQTQPKLDDPNAYAAQVAEYDFAALPTPVLKLAVSLLDHQKMALPMKAAATELVLKREDVSDDVREATVTLLGQRLRDAREYDQAVAAYRQVEARVKLPVQKAQVAVQIGETLLRGAHRFDEAEKEYRRILKTYANAGVEAVLRRSHIGLADIYRHAGDGKKALEEYRAAAAMRVSVATPNEVAVRIGTLARYVEEYTRQKDWEFAFKFLDDWAWEFPEEKVEGHWSLLRAKALIARGDREEALQEALDLTASYPHSAYAVQLLILAAECQVALGRKDQAKALLQTAAEDYPEDPYQNEAKDKLKNIDSWKVEPPKPAAKPEPKPVAKPAPKAAPGK